MPAVLALLVALLLASTPAAAEGACREAWERALSSAEPTLEGPVRGGDDADRLLGEVAASGLLALPSSVLTGDAATDARIVAGVLSPLVVPSPAFTASDRLSLVDVERAYVLLSCDPSDVIDPLARRFCEGWDYAERGVFTIPVCASDVLRPEYLEGSASLSPGPSHAESLCEYSVAGWNWLGKGLDTVYGGTGAIEAADGARRGEGALVRRCGGCEACSGKGPECRCPDATARCDPSECAGVVVFDALRSVEALGAMRFLEPRARMHVGACEALPGDRRLACLSQKAVILEDALARSFFEAEALLSRTPLLRCREEVRRVLERGDGCSRCFDLGIDCYENNLGHQVVRDRGSQLLLGGVEGSLREAMPWYYMARDLAGAASTLFTSARSEDYSLAAEEFRSRGEGIQAFGPSRKAQAEAASRLFYGLYCMQACALARGEDGIGSGDGGWMLDDFHSADVPVAKRLGGSGEGAAGTIDVGVPLVLGPAFMADDGTLDRDALARCPAALLARVQLAAGGEGLAERQDRGGLPWQVHLGARAYLACPHNQAPSPEDAPEDRATLDAMTLLCEQGPYGRNKELCAFDGRLAVGGSETGGIEQTILWGVTGYLMDSMHQSSFKSRIVHELEPLPQEVQSRVFGLVTSCPSPDAEPLIVTVSGAPVVERDGDGVPVVGEDGAWRPLGPSGAPLPAGQPPRFGTLEELAAGQAGAAPVVAVAEADGRSYPVVARAVAPEEVLDNRHFGLFDPSLMAATLYRLSEAPLPAADGGMCTHLYTGGYSRTAYGDLLGHGAVLAVSLGGALAGKGASAAGAAAGAAAGREAAGEAAEAASAGAAKGLARSPLYLPGWIDAKVGGAVTGAGSRAWNAAKARLGRAADTASVRVARAAAEGAAAKGERETAAYVARLTAGETLESAVGKASLPLRGAAAEGGEAAAKSLALPFERAAGRALDSTPRIAVRTPQTLAGALWDTGAFTATQQGGWFRLNDEALALLDGMDDAGRSLVAFRLQGLGLPTGDVTRLMARGSARHPAGVATALPDLGVDAARAIGDALAERRLAATERELADALGDGLVVRIAGTGERAEFRITRTGFEALGPDGRRALRGALGEAFWEQEAAFRGGKALGPSLPADVSTLSDDLYRALYAEAASHSGMGSGGRTRAVEAVANGLRLRQAVVRISDPEAVREATYRFVEEWLGQVDLGAVYAKYLSEELAQRGGARAADEVLGEAAEAAQARLRADLAGRLQAVVVEDHLAAGSRAIAEGFGIERASARDMLARADIDRAVGEALERELGPGRLAGGQTNAREAIDAALRAVDPAQVRSAMAAVDTAAFGMSARMTGILAGLSGKGAWLKYLGKRALHWNVGHGLMRRGLESEVGIDWTQSLFPQAADLWRLDAGQGARASAFGDPRRPGLPIATGEVCEASGSLSVEASCGDRSDGSACGPVPWEPRTDPSLAALQDAATLSPTPCQEGDPEGECRGGVLRVLPDGRCIPFRHESTVDWLGYLSRYLSARRAFLERLRSNLTTLRSGLESQCLRCRADVAALRAYAGCAGGDEGAPLIGDLLAGSDDREVEARLADGLSYAGAAALCTRACGSWEGLEPVTCPLVAAVGSCAAEGSGIAPGQPGVEAVPMAEGFASCVRDVIRAKRACTLLGLRAFTSNVTRSGPPGEAPGSGLRPRPGEAGSDDPCAAVPVIGRMESFLDAYLGHLRGVSDAGELQRKAAECLANAPVPGADPCACVPFPGPGEGATSAYARESAAWSARREACLSVEGGEVAEALARAAGRAETEDLDLDGFVLLLEQLEASARGELEPGAAGLLADLYGGAGLDAVGGGEGRAPLPVGLLLDLSRDISISADRLVPHVLAPRYEAGAAAGVLDGSCRCAGGADGGCFIDASARASSGCPPDGDDRAACIGAALRDALRDRPLGAVNAAVFGPGEGGIVPASCAFACGRTIADALADLPPCVRCPEGVEAVDPASCGAEGAYPFGTDRERDLFLLDPGHPAPVPMVCSMGAAAADGGRRDLLLGPVRLFASLELPRLFPDPGCFDIETWGEDPYAERSGIEEGCGGACDMFRRPQGVDRLIGYCRAMVDGGDVTGECHCAWDDDPVGVPTAIRCRLAQAEGLYRAVARHCREEYGCPSFTNALGGEDRRFACVCGGVGPVDIDVGRAEREGASTLEVERTFFRVEGEVVGPGGPQRAFAGERVSGCAVLRNGGVAAFGGDAALALDGGRGPLEGSEMSGGLEVGPGESTVVCTPAVEVGEALLGERSRARVGLSVGAWAGDREVVPEALHGEPLAVERGRPGLDGMRLEGGVSGNLTTVGSRLRPVAAFRNNRNSPLECTVLLDVVDERGRSLSSSSDEVLGIGPGEGFEVSGEWYGVRGDDVGKRLAVRVRVVNDFGVPVLDETAGERVGIAAPALWVVGSSFRDASSGMGAASSGPCEPLEGRLTLRNPTTTTFEGTVTLGARRPGGGGLLARAHARLSIDPGEEAELATDVLVPSRRGTYALEAGAVDGDGVAWLVAPGPRGSGLVRVAGDGDCGGEGAEEDAGGAEGTGGSGGAGVAGTGASGGQEASGAGGETPGGPGGPAAPSGQPAWEPPWAGEEGAAGTGEGPEACPEGAARRYDLVYCTGPACDARRDGDGGSYLRIAGCMCPEGVVPAVEEAEGGLRLAARTAACCSPCEVARAG